MSYISVAPASPPYDASQAALEGFPEGTTDSDRIKIRKSWTYLWLMTYMAPRFAFYTGAATASAIGMLFTLGLTQIFVWGNIAAAASLKDRIEEMVAWYFKKGREVAKKYIQDYFLFDGTDKKNLQTAMGEIANIREGGSVAVAVSYFDKFLSKKYTNRKNYSKDQKVAFTSAFLNKLGDGKKEQDCIAAGDAALAKLDAEAAAAAAAEAAAAAAAAAYAAAPTAASSGVLPSSQPSPKADRFARTALPGGEMPPGIEDQAEGAQQKTASFVLPALLAAGAGAALFFWKGKKQ